MQVIEKKAEERANKLLCADCHAGATMLCKKNIKENKCNMWKQSYDSYIQGYKDCLKFIKSK